MILSRIVYLMWTVWKPYPYIAYTCAYQDKVLSLSKFFLQFNNNRSFKHESIILSI